MQQRDAVVCASGRDPFLVHAEDFEVSESGITTTEPEEQLQEKEDFNSEEQTFLESIEKEPFVSVTERRVLLGWNDRRYTAIVNSLLRKGKIERVKAKLGRGSPRILYQKKGSTPSVGHEYYVNWIAESLKAKGFAALKNKYGPDIVMPEISTAIEVELGSSNMHGNLKRNLQQFDRVIMCSDQKKLLESLSRGITARNIFFLSIQKVPAFIENMRKRNDLKDT